MGGNIGYTRLARVPFDNQPETLTGQTFTMMIEKERLYIRMAVRQLRAYLIQIFRRGAGTFLFDPPAIGEFTELNDLLVDEEWILHAASQDLTCLREVGIDPQKLFDTELGARLAGLPRVGLGTVVGVKGTGANAEATIDFGDTKPKRLLLRYAPVEKL